MRLIVDAQLPPALARAMRAQGFDAAHVADLGLLAASDHEIAAAAAGGAVVTKDRDFVAISLASGVRVVWLRLGNSSNARLVTTVMVVMPAAVAALEGGEAIVEIQ